MASQPTPGIRVVFGPYELDNTAGVLKKAGRSVRLRGHPLQLLMALLETPGALVTRSQLHERLWPGAAFGDLDQGLNAAVSRLRQALLDSADNPRYIETVPGEGYRFLAPVHRGNLTSIGDVPGPRAVMAMESMASMAAMAPMTTRTVIDSMEARAPVGLATADWAVAHSVNALRRYGIWTGAVLAIVALAGLAFWRSRPVELPAATRTLVTAPEGYFLVPSGTRQSFALSPDGSQLAFTAMDSSGAFHLFVSEEGGAEARQLKGTAGAHTMFWAPDGKSLVAAIQGELRRVPIHGDGQFLLGKAPFFLLSGTFTAPGQLLLDSKTATYTMSASGGEIANAQSFYPWAQVLAGSGTVLYSEWDPKRNHRWVRVAPLGNPKAARDVVETDSRAQYTESLAKPGSGYLLFVKAGNLVALPFDPREAKATGDAIAVAPDIYGFYPTGSADFSVSSQGTLAYQTYVTRSQLAWVDRRGRLLETVGPADMNVASGRLSPDGQWIAAAYYDIGHSQQDLWLLETKTGARRRLAPLGELRDAPQWAGDSKHLAYVMGGRATRVGLRGLGEGDVEEPVASPGGNLFPNDWSPDSRYVLVANTGFTRFANETQSDVWALDLARNRKKTELLSTPYHETDASFSPDGRWLAFTSDESGRPQVYLQAFHGGDNPSLQGRRYPVPLNGALIIRWRADGREFYVEDFDNAVYSVAFGVGGGGTEPKFGKPQRLFSIAAAAVKPVHAVSGFDVSPDGSRFLIPIINADRKGPSVTIVKNWESLLSGR